MKKLPKKNGFTLIELLVVITIIAVLAVIVFAALNPGGRVKDAQDDRRRVDVDSILTAVHEYTVDNNGSLPTGLTAGMDEKQLAATTSGCALATGGCNVATSSACVNLSTPLAKYLKSIPVDPNGGTDTLTNYSIVVDANSIVTVRACNANAAAGIHTSR